MKQLAGVEAGRRRRRALHVDHQVSADRPHQGRDGRRRVGRADRRRQTAAAEDRREESGREEEGFWPQQPHEVDERRQERTAGRGIGRCSRSRRRSPGEGRRQPEPCQSRHLAGRRRRLQEGDRLAPRAISVIVGVALLVTSLGLRRATINRHIRGRLLLSDESLRRLHADGGQPLLAFSSERHPADLEAINWLVIVVRRRQPRRCALASIRGASIGFPIAFQTSSRTRSSSRCSRSVATLILRDRVMATTAVGAVVIGLALQDTLGNLFAGLAIQVEKPFRVGDWVTIGGQDGMVSEITWRATKMRTKAGNFVVVPNSVLARDTITNYCEPTRSLRLQVEVGRQLRGAAERRQVGHSRSAEERAGDPATSACPRCCWSTSAQLVDHLSRAVLGRAISMPTIARRISCARSSITRSSATTSPFRTRSRWRCRPKREACRRCAASSAPTHSRRSRCSLRCRPTSAPHCLRWRSRCSTQPAKRSFVRVRPAGRSSSSFAAKRAVTLAGTSGEVARLRAGDVFGEMSLLTGEARTATVTAVNRLRSGRDRRRRIPLGGAGQSVRSSSTSQVSQPRDAKSSTAIANRTRQPRRPQKRAIPARTGPSLPAPLDSELPDLKTGGLQECWRIDAYRSAHNLVILQPATLRLLYTDPTPQNTRACNGRIDAFRCRTVAGIPSRCCWRRRALPSCGCSCGAYSQCGCSRRSGASDRLRVAAERAAAQSHRLAQTSAALGHARTSTDAIATAIHEPLHWLRAGSGVFMLLSDDRRRLTVARAVGYRLDHRDSWEDRSVGRGLALQRVAAPTDARRHQVCRKPSSRVRRMVERRPVERRTRRPSCFRSPSTARSSGFFRSTSTRPGSFQPTITSTSRCCAPAPPRRCSGCGGTKRSSRLASTRRA